MFATTLVALVAAAGLSGAKYIVPDPCTLASASDWVSSAQAHACELNVPFNKTRSLSVVDTIIKTMQYYTLETWLLKSPNPQIPLAVNVAQSLANVQTKTMKGRYKTDWDFNMAYCFPIPLTRDSLTDGFASITDSINQAKDGHTAYIANCAEAFSWNQPFSIATLATSPTASTSCPYLFVNYDFPNQGRTGLEAYYKGLGFNARKYDGLQIYQINGVDAEEYLVDLANRSSTYDGLFGSYESLQTRYMRLMSRYSADTASGQYTQEVGRFGMRAIYPGADSYNITVYTKSGGKETFTVPWAARFVGEGNTTTSIVEQFCGINAKKTAIKIPTSPNTVKTKMGVIAPDGSQKLREEAPVVDRRSGNYVTPNLTSLSNVVTLDVYQLAKHPKVGVAYFEQFEPETDIDYLTYFQDLSASIYSAFTQLKKNGVEHLIIDQSGNRGGYIYAGAIAMWSFWPQDLYPGFPAVLRDLDLARRESAIAASTNNQNSDYYYGFYRNLSYDFFTDNSQFMDPSVPVTINGVPDAYSQPFFDDFGANSSVFTNFTTPPFAGSDIVFVSNSICASTCSIFSSYLYQKHGVRSAVFGGLPNQDLATAQFDGGIKGSEVMSLNGILGDLEAVGLQDDPAAPQPLPVYASVTVNFRNAIPYIDQQDGILEFVFEGATKHFQFTKQNYVNPQKIWEFVADQFWGQN